MDARVISIPGIRLAIGAESGPSAARAERVRSPAHQPDEYDTEHSGHDACDAQRHFRARQCARRKQFRGAGEGGEQKSLNDEHENDRNDELGHFALTGR